MGAAISGLFGGGGDNSGLTALMNQQSAQATQLQTELLQQPKMVQPDNFLASKNKLLSQIKLGLASTISGGQGGAVAQPTLGASMSGAGKKTMGS